MYGRSGLLQDARLVFETTRNERNVDSWNAMLMGYIQNGLYIEAVKFVYQMKAARVHPHESLLDKLRIACVLNVLLFLVIDIGNLIVCLVFMIMSH